MVEGGCSIPGTEGEDDGGRTVKAPKKSKAPLPPRANTAVYVTGLPLNVTIEEVAEVFSRKCGVIAEEIDSGKTTNQALLG